MLGGPVVGWLNSGEGVFEGVCGFGSEGSDGGGWCYVGVDDKRR